MQLFLSLTCNGNLHLLNTLIYRYHHKILKNLLLGWFCFIQQDDGKVVAVQHATNESDDAINLKKAIAAAFQANFKGTANEDEIDTQSFHHAHYRYDHNNNYDIDSISAS